MASIIVCIGSLLSAGALLLILEKENKVACFVAAGFLGFFVVSIMSVGLDFGCEVSYPVPANNVTGVMISYSMIISGIHILAANFIFVAEADADTNRPPKSEARIMVGILLGTIAVALLFAILSKEDLRKNEIDAKNESKLSAQILPEDEE